jgi:hypothetical protein
LVAHPKAGMKEISFRLFFYYFQQTICVKQLLRISPAAAKAEMCRKKSSFWKNIGEVRAALLTILSGYTI